jgi:hypothetical protein
MSCKRVELCRRQRTQIQKKLLDRIVVMLTKLGQRGYSVREKLDTYDRERVESESDTDSDIISGANRSEKENAS